MNLFHRQGSTKPHVHSRSNTQQIELSGGFLIALLGVVMLAILGLRMWGEGHDQAAANPPTSAPYQSIAHR